MGGPGQGFGVGGWSKGGGRCLSRQGEEGEEGVMEEGKGSWAGCLPCLGASNSY